MASQINEFRQINKTISSVRTNFEGIRTLSLPSDDVSSFTNSINGLTIALNGVKQTAGHARQAFVLLSDEQFMNNLDKILAILQVIASLKGFDKLANSISTVRDKAEQLQKTLASIGQISYQELLDRNAFLANSYLFLQNIVQHAFTGIGIAIKLAALAMAGLVAFNISKYFEGIVTAVTLAQGAVGKSMAAIVFSFLAMR